MSHPGYVQTTVCPKWIKADCDAITDHVLAGETSAGFIAYPYKFIVRSISGVYDAVNAIGTRVYGGAADTGGVDGADANAVVEAALADLTVGRTWRELVVLEGSFTFTDEITVASHTWIHLNGKITMADGTNKNIWKCYNGATSVDNVEISGGVYDMGTQTAGNVVTATSVVGYFHDFTVNEGYLPVYIHPNSSHVLVERVKCYDASLQAININGVDVKAKDCLVHGGCSEFGIVVAEGSDLTVEGCHIEDTTLWGIEIGYASYNTNIVGNTIIVNHAVNASDEALLFLPKTNTTLVTITKAENIRVSGNKIYGGAPCIRFSHNENFQLEHVIIEGNQLFVADAGNGIDTTFSDVGHVSRLKYVLVNNNTIRNVSGATGTIGVAASGTSWRVYNNDLVDCDTPINTYGAWTVDFRASNNLGVASSGSGANVLSTAFAVDATGNHTLTIAHTLSRTPLPQECMLSVITYPNGGGSLAKDWAYDLLEIDSRNVDATNVVVVINVSTASLTAGTTAKVALRVNDP